MEYIVIALGVIALLAGIGNQAIKFGGNEYFGKDHRSFTECLAEGCIIALKVFVFILSCAAIYWALNEVTK